MNDTSKDVAFYFSKWSDLQFSGTIGPIYQ